MSKMLKPSLDMIEGKWIVNSAVSQNGEANTSLFDGTRGTWNSIHTFYWYTVGTHYIDITLLQKSAIWVLPNPLYLSYNKGLTLSRWTGSNFIKVEVLPDRTNENKWEKMIELDAGRYRFTANATYRMDDEWFIESLATHKFGLKSTDNKIYGNSIQKNESMTNLANTANISKVTVSKGGPYNILNNPNLVVSTSTGGWYTGTDAPSGWITFEFFKKTSIDKIGICSFYVSGYEPIHNFIFEGSNTGEFNGEQVALYNGKHEYSTVSEYKYYSFMNPHSFKFYRINVLDIHYGNGQYNLMVPSVVFYKESSWGSIISIPEPNAEVVKKFFSEGKLYLDTILANREYLLQDSTSKNADGLLVQEIVKKPLSIKFE